MRDFKLTESRKKRAERIRLEKGRVRLEMGIVGMAGSGAAKKQRLLMP